MPASLSTLVTRTRSFLRDWPDNDTITASVASSGTTLTVADATDYADNWALEIDSEVLVCTSTASSGTSVSVARARRGTTAASHASGSVILVRPTFFTYEIIDALNAGIEAAFPLIYRRVVDETLTGSAEVYEYVIPDMPGHPGYVLPYLEKIYLKESSETAFRLTNAWELVRGATPKIKFRRALDGDETIRLIGYGPLPRLVALSDTLDAQFPPHAETALVEYAAGYLMASKETEPEGRADTSNADAYAAMFQNPMRTSNALMQRYYNRIGQASMPPPGRHVRSII